MNKKTSIMEQAKLAKKVDKHDNDLIDDIIEMLRYKRKQSVIKGKAQEEPVELAEEQDMILETEERELLQRQIDRITFVDDAPDKSNNLPTEERELMEDFRNKLVQELEDFNKNVDKTLKVAGELRLERESLDDNGGVVDLEKDAKPDVFTNSHTNFEFKGPKESLDQKDDKQGSDKVDDEKSIHLKKEDSISRGVSPIQFYEEEIEPNDEQKMQIP